MKIAIIGSRDYPRLQQVSDYVRSLPPDTVVVSGGAAGVDIQAERAARSLGLRVSIVPVDTVGLSEDEEERRREYGKRAYERNTKIVTFADEVVAFWTWCSRPNCKRGPDKHRTHGTQHAISEAIRLGKTLKLNGPDGTRTA